MLSSVIVEYFLKGVVTLKEVARTFHEGAHHPTMLVILQALLTLIGEVSHQFPALIFCFSLVLFIGAMYSIIYHHMFGSL